MTAQEKDRIECAIRHIQTAVDVDPWAVEIAVEAMRVQLVKENQDFSQGFSQGTVRGCGEKMIGGGSG